MSPFSTVEIKSLKCVVPEKYPYPHHGGNWKFQRDGGGGGGVGSPGNSRGVGGLTVKLTSRWFISIQYRPTAVVVKKLLLTDFGGTF